MKKFNEKVMKSDKGFTMIELIIVIAILGILAAILVPSFAAMSRKSRLNADLNTIRNVQTQVEVYQAEHDGLYPGVVEVDKGEQKNVLKADEAIAALIAGGYIKKSDVKDDKVNYQTTGAVTAARIAADTDPFETGLILNLTGADEKVKAVAGQLTARDKVWISGSTDK